MDRTHPPMLEQSNVTRLCTFTAHVLQYTELRMLQDFAPVLCAFNKASQPSLPCACFLQLSQMRDNVYSASKSAYTYFFGPPADTQPGITESSAAKPGTATPGAAGFETDSNGRTALPVFPVMPAEAEAGRGGSGRL